MPISDEERWRSAGVIFSIVKITVKMQNLKTKILLGVVVGQMVSMYENVHKQRM